MKRPLTPVGSAPSVRRSARLGAWPRQVVLPRPALLLGLLLASALPVSSPLAFEGTETEMLTSEMPASEDAPPGVVPTGRVPAEPLAIERPGDEAPRSQVPWQLQTQSDVVVSRPVVRLADVVLPVAVPAEHWERISQSVIGLVPADGRPLQLERQRLAESLRHRLTSAQPVRWSGPPVITIRYQPAPSSSAAVEDAPERRSNPNSAADNEETTQRDSPAALSEIMVTTALDPRSLPSADAAAVKQPKTTAATETFRAAPEGEVPTPAEVNRVWRLIEATVRRQRPDVTAAYEIHFDADPSAPGIASLSGLRQVTSVEFAGALEEGPMRLHVRGMKESEPHEQPISVQLKPHPRAVVPVRAVLRGQVIAASDVRLEPVVTRSPSQQVDWAVRLEEVVGMEAQRGLTVGRPVSQSDVAPPTVIRRNEMVELRVLAGGVVVTTSARAMESGAAGQPIAIEVLDPRRRLLGRVAGPGVVEIVSRPPTTRD